MLIGLVNCAKIRISNSDYHRFSLAQSIKKVKSQRGRTTVSRSAGREGGGMRGAMHRVRGAGHRVRGARRRAQGVRHRAQGGGDGRRGDGRKEDGRAAGCEAPGTRR
ncbi:MAG: hypothetical protein P1P83_12030 [Bacteroidales bacterium]|nr:hypothetical protein [Bacteroidales bacterium]MDT8374035.1 hypothetical protein [Bacteroidales bacterium]